MRNSRLFKLTMMSILMLTATAAFGWSTASAWTTTAGGLSLAATAPTSKLTINTASPVGVQCTGTSTSGSLLSTSSTVVESPEKLSSSLTLTFTGCTAAGLAASVNCSGAAPELWGNSYTSGVTTGEIRNVLCSITVTSLPGCKITVTGTGTNGRAVYGTYANATGQLTVLNPTSGTQIQTLTASWNSSCTILTPRPGSASANFTNLSNGALVYTSTASPKPVVTNP